MQYESNNFRNEIIWQKASGRAKGSQYDPKTFGSDHDVILFYTKQKEYCFNGTYVDLTENEFKKKFPHEYKQGHYNTDVPIFCAPAMGARPNLCYE